MKKLIDGRYIDDYNQTGGSLILQMECVWHEIVALEFIKVAGGEMRMVFGNEILGYFPIL